MSMKKIFALVLALVLVVGLTACGGSQKADKSKDAPTLTWWLIGGTPPNIDDAMKDLNEYLAPTYGVKVDVKAADWGEWDDKMVQIINTGDEYDIMFMNVNRYANFINQNAFLDITDMVETVTPELYEFIPEIVWDGARFEDRIYSVPTYKDSSQQQMWGFDHDIVEKYDLDLDSYGEMDYDSLDKSLVTIKEGEGEGFYPLPQSQGDGFNGLNVDYDGIALGFPFIGIKYNDGSRTVKYMFEEEEVVERYRYLHKWYEEGIINPDAPAVQDTPKYRAVFSAQGFPGADVMWAKDSGIDQYDIVNVFGPIYTTETIQGSLNTISSNSDHPEEALKLLQAVNLDQKVRDSLGYGQEGVNFEYVDEDKNVVRILDTPWGIGNYAIGTFFNMATQEGTPEDQWDLVKGQNERAFASEALGFAFNQEGFDTEVANVRSAWDKYKHDFVTGALDPDEAIPKITEELKAAGLDTILEEAQRQVDEFFAE